MSRTHECKSHALWELRTEGGLGDDDLKRDVDAQTAKNLLKRFECAICISIAWHPVQLHPCEHIFCFKCVETLSSCPYCRTSINAAAELSKERWETLGELSITCPVHRTNGCEWTGSYSDAINHLASSCQYVQAPCDLCQQLVPRREIPEHKSNHCSHRRVPCRYCRETFLHTHLEAHEPPCEHSPQAFIPCPFRSLVGCCVNVDIRRADMNPHLVVAQATHITFVRAKVDAFNELETQVEALMAGNIQQHTDLTAIAAELEHQQHLVTVLQLEMQSQQQTIEDLQQANTTIPLLQQQVATLSSEKQLQQQTIVSLQQAVGKLSSERAEQREHLESLAQQADILTQQNQQQQVLIAELEQDVSALSMESKELHKTMSSLERKVAKQKTEKKQQSEVVTQLQQEVQRLKKELIDEQLRCRHCRVKMSTATAEGIACKHHPGHMTRSASVVVWTCCFENDMHMPGCKIREHKFPAAAAATAAASS